eukprot:scaffold100654_cov15-Tisochrysis_lutea.AAC.1
MFTASSQKATWVCQHRYAWPMHLSSSMQGTPAPKVRQAAAAIAAFPNMIMLLLEAAGYQQAFPDTYFYQSSSTYSFWSPSSRCVHVRIAMSARKVLKGLRPSTGRFNHQHASKNYFCPLPCRIAGRAQRAGRTSSC